MTGGQRILDIVLILAVVFSLLLIAASSVMHLGNAGVGGDPAAYGRILPPDQAVAEAENVRASVMPQKGIDRLHRAVASFLQVLVIVYALLVFLRRKQAGQYLAAAMAALAVSLALALLGIVYGSPLRYPWLMLVNFLGGVILLSLYWWLLLHRYQPRPIDVPPGLKGLAAAALGLVIVQITLGAWTDAYYAAMACKTFPDCHGGWWLGADLLRGLSLLGTLQVDAGGRVIIDRDVAMAIHMAHRLGAAVTLLGVALLALRAIVAGGLNRHWGGIILLLLCVQIGLGIMMVLHQLPLGLAVAHSVNAAMLILAVLSLLHRCLQTGGS